MTAAQNQTVTAGFRIKIFRIELQIHLNKHPELSPSTWKVRIEPGVTNLFPKRLKDL